MKARLKEQLIGKEVEAQASQMKNEVRKKLQKNLKKTSENRLTNKNQCDITNELARKSSSSEKKLRFKPFS